jgi:hypothetical protein
MIKSRKIDEWGMQHVYEEEERLDIVGGKTRRKDTTSKIKTSTGG